MAVGLRPAPRYFFWRAFLVWRDFFVRRVFFFRVTTIFQVAEGPPADRKRITTLTFTLWFFRSSLLPARARLIGTLTRPARVMRMLLGLIFLCRNLSCRMFAAAPTLLFVRRREDSGACADSWPGPGTLKMRTAVPFCVLCLTPTRRAESGETGSGEAAGGAGLALTWVCGTAVSTVHPKPAGL